MRSEWAWRSGRRGAAGLAAAVALTVAATLALAAVPSAVLIQGVLLSKGGGPVSDGVYDVTFALYAAQTGGQATWSETAKVAVQGGELSHALGSVKPLSNASLAGLKQAWLGLKVGVEPEMKRQRLHAVTYARRAAVAEAADFTYAGSKTKGGPASDLQCTGCVSVGELKIDADLDLGGNALKAKTVVAQSVSASSFSGDGSKLTGLKVPAGNCKKAGEVVKGIQPDGTLLCVKAMDASALPADGLDEISNGLLTNQYVDEAFGKKGLPIQDNNPTGVSDTIDFPDVGLAQELDVLIDLTNSDISKMTLWLFAPDNTKYVLYDKGGKGTILKGTWPGKDKTVSGDLTTWVGKNPKGKWRLQVIDVGFKNNNVDGQVKSWSVRIKTLSSKKVSSAGKFIATGGFQYPVADKAPEPCNAGNLGYSWVNSKSKALHICNGDKYYVINLSVPDGSQSNPAFSCKQLLADNKEFASKDGVYWLKPKLYGGNAFKVWCDMSTHGGGWTLIGKTAGLKHNGDGGVLDGFDKTRWVNKQYLGDVTSLTQANALGPAYESVPFSDFMLQGLQNKSKKLAWRMSQTFPNLFSVFTNSTQHKTTTLLVGNHKSLDWRPGCGSGNGPDGTGPQFYGFNINSDAHGNNGSLVSGYGHGWCSALAGWGRNNQNSNYTGGGLGANCQGRGHQMGRHYWGYGDGCNSSGWSNQSNLNSFHGHAFYVR